MGGEDRTGGVNGLGGGGVRRRYSSNIYASEEQQEECVYVDLPTIDEQRGTSSRRKKPSQLEVMSVFAHLMEGISQVMVQARAEEEKNAEWLSGELEKLVGQDYQFLIFNSEHISSAYDYLLQNSKIAKGFL